MEHELACTCGRRVTVSEGAAGASITCTCGSAIQVPSLDELRRAALQIERASPGREKRPPIDAMRFAWGILASGMWLLVCILPIAGSFGPLGFFGGVLFCLGQFWLLILVVREWTPGETWSAYFLLPLFILGFVWRRRDLMAGPFCCCVFGAILIVIGMAR
jgi:hypothetical protein